MNLQTTVYVLLTLAFLPLAEAQEISLVEPEDGGRSITVVQMIEATDSISAKEILRRSGAQPNEEHTLRCDAESPRFKVGYDDDGIWFSDAFNRRGPVLFQKAPSLDQVAECTNLAELLDLIDKQEESPARKAVIEENDLDINFGPVMGDSSATIFSVSVGFVEAKKITIAQFELSYLPTKEAKLLSTPLSRKSVTLSVMSGFLKK